MTRKEYTLLFFTATFPYGKGEAFIEAEINYLAQAFEKVIIVPEQRNGTPRLVPSNVFIHESPRAKKTSLNKLFFGVFSLDLWKELVFVKRILKLPFSLNIFKIALKTFIDAQHYASWIQKEFPEDENNPYVFYTYWCDTKTLALTKLKPNRHKDRFITRLHGWDVYQERHNPPYLPFRKYMAEGLDALVFISENGRKYFQRVWKQENNNRLKLFRLGTRQPLPLNGEQKLHLVSCSGIIPLKRVDLIADAVISLNGKISWTHLGDGPLMGDIQKKVKDANAESYITLKGSMTNEDVHRWFSENPGGFFINVSRSEGLPVSVMEAMSYGFPVIATNVGGTSEIVSDGYNGFLLPSNPNQQQVADALITYINLSVEEKRKMGQQAYNTWEEGYAAGKKFMEFTRFLIQL